MSKDSLGNFNHFDLLWPSKYLKAGDLRGKEVTVVIDEIEPRHELIGQGNKRDTKPVFWLRTAQGRKIEKSFVCNKTNGRRILAMYGAEVTAWVGKAITLFAEENARSDSGFSIGVKKPRQAQATNGTQQARSEQQRRQELNTDATPDSSSDDFADIGDPPMSEEQQTEFGDAMANDDRRAAGT